MTVDAAMVHAHMETDLSNEALGRLIADAIAAIEERCGVEDELTATLLGGQPFLFLPRPITAADDVSEITERWTQSLEVVLDPEDWRWWGGRQLERLWTGPHAGGAWAPQVTVTYTPKIDGRRDRVTIDLVRLAIQYNALGSERAGDYSASGLDYQKERERLISELVPKAAFA